MERIIFTAILILTLHFVVFSQTSKDKCPKYEIIAPPGVTTFGNYAVFQLRGDENFEQLKPSYFWTVSDGEIYAGQGMKILVVSSKSATEAANVKAVVTIQNLPAGCADTQSETAVILGEPKPVKVDEYGGKAYSGEIKARLDTFYSALANDPTASGVITVKSKTKENIVRQIQSISQAIRFRQYDLSRVSFRIIFDKDAETIENWLVPSGAYFPVTENAININASEYKNIQNFFTVNPRKRRK